MIETKECPICKRILPIANFGLEGKNRFGSDGKPARRRICNQCRYLRSKLKKNRNEIEKAIKYCALCDKIKLKEAFDENGIYCKKCLYKIKNKEYTEKDILKAQERLIKRQDALIDDINEKAEVYSNKEKLVSAIIELSRAELNRLEVLTREEFIQKTNSEDILESIGLDFDVLRDEAKLRLFDLGFKHQEGKKLGCGKYLIVGDSHGKHTKKKMFKLLRNLNKRLKIDKIIHIGHILDDDNVISYCWKDFDNLIVLSKIEEANFIEEHIKQGYNFEVVRNYLYLGKLKVMNQDIISDYVKTFVSTIDQVIYPEPMVVNSHRHEIDGRCTYDKLSIISSPGCLCEKHIVKTIKQIDFTAGYQIKQAKAEGFIKYRRMKHMYEFWEQGALLVDIDKNNNFSILPLRIKYIEGEYATSVFDKIYIGDKVKKPMRKIFINADMHCDLYDEKILEIQSSVVKDYKPDIYINLGDMLNNRSLNHHILDRTNYIDKSFLEENASVAFILAKTAKWAKKKYLFFGNHERFIKDFYEKYPQLKSFLLRFIESLCEEYGFELVNYKDVLDIDGLKCIHGDMKFFGQRGNLLEKVSRTFGKDTVIGHLHFTGIRFGCYVIGMTGKKDQQYNEINASKWLHGFGICNQYGGENWLSNFTIDDYRITINGKEYRVNKKALNNWKMPNYIVKVKYDFD